MGAEGELKEFKNSYIHTQVQVLNDFIIPPHDHYVGIPAFLSGGESFYLGFSRSLFDILQGAVQFCIGVFLHDG